MSIEAMKQALEALEQWNTPLYKRGNVIESLRQAIAEAKKQEPVVWMYQDKSTHEVRFQKHMRGFVDHGATYETPLYTAPQPQREWVGLIRGVRVDGDTVVITVKGGNEAARQLCAELLKEKNT